MNLQDFITRHLHGTEHEHLFDASTEPIGETEWDFETPQGPQFEHYDMREMTREDMKEFWRKSMPRVLPPEHERPGVKDHSLIKAILRRSGWLK